MAALPLRGRLLFAILAIVLLAIVGMMRVRAVIAGRRTRPTFDAYERAERIREERNRRISGR